jgi:hypothetical protein
MAVINRINTTVNAAFTDVDSIITYASYDSLFPVYTAVKGFICCNFADVIGNMWVALTLAGEFLEALLSVQEDAAEVACCAFKNLAAR